MNQLPNLLQLRRILAARFPRWTQPFWTWITGIAMPDEPPRRHWTNGTHLGGLLLAWIATSVLGVASVSWDLQATLRMTWSTKCVAVCDMRRASNDGQKPRRLQLKASSLSCPHSPQPQNAVRQDVACHEGIEVGLDEPG